MEVIIQKSIQVIVTTSKEKIGGGVPIFVVDNKEEVEEKALLFENLLGGMAHAVDENTYVLVRH